MGQIRKQYTREFKVEAVRLVEERGRSKAQLAREVGVLHHTCGDQGDAFLSDSSLWPATQPLHRAREDRPPECSHGRRQQHGSYRRMVAGTAALADSSVRLRTAAIHHWIND